MMDGAEQTVHTSDARKENGASDGSASEDTVDSSSSKQLGEASDECEKASPSSESDNRRGAARKQSWKSQSVGDTSSTSGQSSSSNGGVGGGGGGGVGRDNELNEHSSFSVNRELWQRRATSQTHLNPPGPTPKFLREMRQKHTPDLVMDLPLSAQDPVNKSSSTSSLSSSDEESPAGGLRLASGPESPDMSTAAERFAKQNQCTLKKNTKSASDNGKPAQPGGAEFEGESEPERAIVRSASSHQISDHSLPLRSPLPARSTPKIAAKFADMHLTGGSQAQIVSSFKPQVKLKPAILRKPVLPYPHPHMSPELARKIEKQAQSAEQAN